MAKNQKPNKKYIDILLILLKKHYPKAKIALNYENNFELLTAVILSAQSTDKQINKITEKLFPKYQKANFKSQKYKSKFKSLNKELQEIINFVEVDIQELEQDIKSSGFFRNKAKNIQKTARIILEKHSGKLPKTMEEMTILPGVARKTANIVLGNAYGIVEGIAVDTHVKRLSNRLGLTANSNPDKIEKDLMEVLPKGEWFKITYQLIDHGRAICDAKKPKCDECFLNKICPSAFDFPQFA